MPSTIMAVMPELHFYSAETADIFSLSILLILGTLFLSFGVYLCMFLSLHCGGRSTIYTALLFFSTALFYFFANSPLFSYLGITGTVVIRMMYASFILLLASLLITVHDETVSMDTLSPLPGALAFSISAIVIIMLTDESSINNTFRFFLFTGCMVILIHAFMLFFFSIRRRSKRIICIAGGYALFTAASALFFSDLNVGIFSLLFLTASQLYLYAMLSRLYIFRHVVLTQAKSTPTLQDDSSNSLTNDNSSLIIHNRPLACQSDDDQDTVRKALKSVESTLVELEKAHRKIEHDLIMASSVQRIYFSQNIPSISDWESSFVYRPMRQVSGDMYDLYVNDGTLIGASLFDVSGHGVQSALITMLAKNIISELFYKLYEKPAGYILEIINKRLIEEIGAMDNYMTGLLVKINDKVLQVSNASHANILHRSDKTGKVRQLVPKHGNGNFLGIPLMDEPYPTDVYRIENEDSILLYSDGIYEQKMRGLLDASAHETLITAFEQCRMYQSARSQLEYLLKGLQIGNGEREQADDLTLVLLKKRAAKSS
ncbi:MAG: PP2C family protein-serine/threonine phosphatase [Spirochaetota bacterium]